MKNEYNNPIPVVVAVVAQPFMQSIEAYKNRKKRYFPFSQYEKEVEAGIKYLQIKRGVEPEKNKWALPAGFMNEKECPEAAVLRELREETGLEGKVKGLLKVENPLPGELNQILLYYNVDVGDFSPLKAADDALDTRFRKYFWKSSDRSFKDLAFGSHINVIKEALEKRYQEILDKEF